MGEQEHEIAVVLQTAPPEVDPLLLAGFVRPVDPADDGALAGVGQRGVPLLLSATVGEVVPEQDRRGFVASEAVVEDGEGAEDGPEEL